jgi:hypothetical protein
LAKIDKYRHILVSLIILYCGLNNHALSQNIANYDDATKPFANLKHLVDSGKIMFGMANPTSINPIAKISRVHILLFSGSILLRQASH